MRGRLGLTSSSGDRDWEQLWDGVSSRLPLTSESMYQVPSRRLLLGVAAPHIGALPKAAQRSVVLVLTRI